MTAEGSRWGLVFETLPIAVRIEDFSSADRKLAALHLESTTDLAAFLGNQPRALPDLLVGIEVEHATPAALQLYHAADLADLSRILKELRQTPAYGAIYRDVLFGLAARLSHISLEYNVQLDALSSITVSAEICKLDEPTRQSDMIVWIEHDITAHKITEAKLRLSEARLKAVVAHAPMAITLEDLDGNILLANPKAIEFFGIEADADAYSPRGGPDRPAHVDVLSQITKRALESGVPVHVDIDLPGGAFARKGDLVKFPISVEMREPIAIGTICADVTEQRNAEDSTRRLAEELARAERWVTVGQISGALSHELNQPLGAILNYGRAALRLLREGHECPADLPILLEKICRQAVRSSQIIRDLRGFLGTRNAQIGNVDINAIIRNTIDIAMSSINDHQIAHEFRPAEALPPVRAGRISIEQAVLNIIANAVDAMQEVEIGSRRLEIWTQLIGTGFVEIGISDTGLGVPAAVRDRLFEPFATTKPHGTGLGLSICRTLVEQFGGKVEARPRKPGMGAAFVIRLPVARPR